MEARTVHQYAVVQVSKRKYRVVQSAFSTGRGATRIHQFTFTTDPIDELDALHHCRRLMEAQNARLAVKPEPAQPESPAAPVAVVDMQDDTVTAEEQK